MTPRALYIHIPFCTRRCGYCAFHSTATWTRASTQAIVGATEDDVSSITRLLDDVDTLYVGGGTPTTLEPAALVALIGRVRSAAPGLAEITVEANPESASTAMLQALDDAGVTRLSVGVQSLEAQALAALDRRRTPIGELEAIRVAWPRTLSADLIHASPGSTTGGMLATVDKLATIGVDHLSIYGLSIEPGTPLAARVAKGELTPREADDWPTIVARIRTLGFERYEVSNFARPGAECRHNIHYWHGDDYVGLGPSAVSTLEVDGRRLRATQPSDHRQFLERRHVFDCEREDIDEQTRFRESLMLALRTRDGLPVSVLASLDARTRSRLDAAIRELSASSDDSPALLEAELDALRPTEAGMDLLDRVLVRLFTALDPD